ncbi:MAG: hypothetical protein R6V85_08210 [Polyangia bacterium]
MSRRFNRAIVVDTSVVRAAGPSEESRPPGGRCHKCLRLMLDRRIGVVMTSDVWKEWSKVDSQTGRRHMSSYASKWLTAMTARKLRLDVQPPPTSERLLAAIREDLETEKKRTAVSKDVLVVDAALASDCRVLSLDDKVRLALRDLCSSFGGIAKIHWLSPTQKECIPWLENEAPDNPVLMLCAGIVD